MDQLIRWICFQCKGISIDCFVGIVGGFINQPQALAPAIATILQYLQKLL